MEFFHEPKIDWMGIKWYLIALSLALAAAGLISMAVKGGLAYGIDFRGGTVVNVSFPRRPTWMPSAVSLTGRICVAPRFRDTVYPATTKSLLGWI